MKQLKNNYEYHELKELSKSHTIERAYRYNIYGTSGIGYVCRHGLLIDGLPYQVVYSSKGYGRITNDITFYNGRYHDKYRQYDVKIDEWNAKHLDPYLTN